jgi:hypothetical protein
MADSAFFVSFSLNQVHLTTVASHACGRQPANAAGMPAFAKLRSATPGCRVTARLVSRYFSADS